MRPDLFAGSALRDDSHRILARLANGGSVPAPARQWRNGDVPQRAQLAAVAALLAAIAAAWAWLQDEGAPTPPAPGAVAHSEPPLMPTYAPTQQAATIVNETPRAASARATPVPSVAPARLEVHAARPHAARPAVVQHGQSNAPAIENDEDVTLLAAMLKHGKQQKPSATPPKE